MLEVDGVTVLFEEFLLFLWCGRNWLCHFVAFLGGGGL
jgi:hypothetical protein